MLHQNPSDPSFSYHCCEMQHRKMQQRQCSKTGVLAFLYARSLSEWSGQPKGARSGEKLARPLTWPSARNRCPDVIVGACGDAKKRHSMTHLARTALRTNFVVSTYLSENMWFLAERQGFEPWEGLHPQRFSRPPRSTTPPPLRDCDRRPDNLTNHIAQGHSVTIACAPCAAPWKYRPPCLFLRS
jgi:hypothetical protein